MSVVKFSYHKVDSGGFPETVQLFVLLSLAAQGMHSPGWYTLEKRFVQGISVC